MSASPGKLACKKCIFLMFAIIWTSVTVRDLGAFWWKEGVRNCVCVLRDVLYLTLARK